MNIFPHQSHNDNNYDEIIENIKISETKKIKCITNKKSQKHLLIKLINFWKILLLELLKRNY